MNNPIDPTLRELNDCDACAGTGVQTPAIIDNRPALPAVEFRVGIHSQFKATMLAALSSQARPELLGLRTRSEDDFTIALLDAFASTADVLTFYSERIANEAYLRTATERRSVLELGRFIGYELAPGVAAQVMLAFTVEGAAGAPGAAIIPKGTRVQSIPGPGENPQVYETSLEFAARAEWNELRPRLRAVPLSGAALLSAKDLYLDGVTTNLKPGDVLVLADGVTPDASARRISQVAADRERGHTKVTFEESTDSETAQGAQMRVAMGPPLQTEAADISNIRADDALTMVTFLGKGAASPQRVRAHVKFFDLDPRAAQTYLNSRPITRVSQNQDGVFALRKRVGHFGHNAPKWGSLPSENNPYTEDWDKLETSGSATTIWQDSQGDKLTSEPGQFDVVLERPVKEVVKDGWIVLETGTTLLPFRVVSASEASRADYAMSAKCTGIQLKTADNNPLEEAVRDVFKNRATTCHVDSEPLSVIGQPLSPNLTKGLTALELDRIDLDLVIGQSVAIKGEDSNPPGKTQSEIVVIAGIDHSDMTTLTLREGLQNSYLRSTVTINANVVAATHGETAEETLGSGDASLRFQQFVLKQKPLTYVLPPDGSSLSSSLEVWVNDIRWTEAPTFFGRGPRDRIYVVRLADDGVATVQFGDGRRGARLPTGRENVRAVYRHGIGMGGLVAAGQISLLITQPLGVKGVSNPKGPEGAEDPQSLNDSRANAPLTVLTLDRVVSLQDYEDFARDFPGVSKAHAAWTWSGRSRGVLLSLLGPDGIAIGDVGQPADPLRGALLRKGIPRVPVRIVSRPPSFFSLTGTVRIEADRVPSVVEADVYAALRQAFSFSAREFGQGVHISEVIAVIQNVRGVAFIDVKDFQKTALVAGADLTVPAAQGYLAAHQPANGVGSSLAEPAELLVLDEASLSQLEVTSV